MAILPKNRAMLLNFYNKNKKEILLETQSMLDTELFFKMKEKELLAQIEAENSLNEEDIIDKDLVEEEKNKKSA